MRELTAELRSAVLAFVLAGSASTGLIAWIGLDISWWVLLLALNAMAGLFCLGLGWSLRRGAPLAGAALALALGLLGAAASQAFLLPAQLLSDPIGVHDASVLSVLLVGRLGIGGAGLYLAVVLLLALLAGSLALRARRRLAAPADEDGSARPAVERLFLSAAACFLLHSVFLQSWTDPAALGLAAIDAPGKALGLLLATGLAGAAAYRPALAGPSVLAALAAPADNAPIGPDRVRRALTAVLYVAVAGLAAVVIGLLWGKEWPALRPWLALVWWVCAPLVVLVAVLAVARWALERLRKRLAAADDAPPSEAAPNALEREPPPRSAPVPPPPRLELIFPPSPKPRRNKRGDLLTLLVTLALALGGLGAILFGFGMSALWEFLFPLTY